MTNFMDLRSRFLKIFTENLFYKILILSCLILFFIYATHYINKKPNNLEITFGSTTIYAQVADTENKRSLGLSYTQKIGENAGMLFVFPDSAIRNFWMRDMYFDLDMLWLDENKQVVGFFENVSKDSYHAKDPSLSKIYHSPDNTKYVLEVNAGTISKFENRL